MSDGPWRNSVTLVFRGEIDTQLMMEELFPEIWNWLLDNGFDETDLLDWYMTEA